MGIVLVAMGGYGTYLGWQIRAGNGGDATFGTPDTAAALHPKLMTLMTLLFLAGGQGGLLFNLLEGRPILESPHAVSALAGLGLLAANGALGTVMTDKAALRCAALRPAPRRAGTSQAGGAGSAAASAASWLSAPSSAGGGAAPRTRSWAPA